MADEPVGQSEARPPDFVTLVWCPVCGRDDRYTALRERLPHNTPNGRRCLGRPMRLSYVINERAQRITEAIADV